ncbi:CBASS oligonucleotide cyclase [Thiomicrorhabdus sp.]|uniref:CBASS oligonucleotide cyclase n=1 Tax=Thiomicrorhabdus sp. TaxID=2039724 RepID=UPI002AA72781|nr:CBASS oligonucleotide cyclase [Thiomicrorhabdus sp.]
MGGSGGSSWSSPSDIAKKVRDEEKKVDAKEFQTKVSEYLSELLTQFNGRDVPLIQRRLEEILNKLKDDIEDKVDQIYGGSVAKHTYVDGLSDIDCLLMINRTDLEGKSPREVLGAFEDALKDKLKGEAEVSSGQLAVTVTYGDGMEIQLLPAVKSGDSVKIPSARSDKQWSNVDPKKFHTGLTKYNEKCDGKLVPTIKLAKAIISQLPEARQLSGYHVESLAIDAFKNYKGPKTTASMLPHFFEHSKTRVLSPMTDSTGQSVHVDTYMGNANSSERNAASHLLGRISKRMGNANASGSLDQWADMFGDKK